ncbi:MAG: glycogen/starch synthase, partial [Chloroflexi bacterium]|nr:glycogen/starch synthase [Chloroflexota bacterium]
LALGRDGGDVFSRARGVLTVHNLAFQGWFDERYRRRWDLVPAEAVAEQVDGVSLESMIALGLRHADAITAVSPTYAQEILTPEFGERLDPLLRARAARLRGILNGIDVDAFNPETDTAISPNFSAGTLGLKAEVKAALQHEAGLPLRPDVPVIGLVTRMTEQKGLDIVIPALEALVREADTQVIMIGSGDRSLEAAFSDFVQRHPSLMSVRLGYDVAYAQRIYAGADMFLMPSRFEPCGIGQLIALRYGTVPVVRATGGLIDTVFDWQDERRGNGFLFKTFSAEALLLALSRALEVYKLRSLWRGIQERGMSADHSWSRSAGQYVEVYRRLTGELPPELADSRHTPARTRRRA